MTYNGKYVKVEGNGEEKLDELLNNRPRRVAIIKQFLNHWGSFAQAQQRIYAPVGETGYLHRHIDMSSISYAPGGAGGGGSYVMTIGVRNGNSKHPFYVHFGTAHGEGESFNTYLNAGSTAQGRIYPKGGRTAAAIYLKGTDSKAARIHERSLRTTAKNFEEGKGRAALTFQKKGEPRRFRAWVSGQSPKPFVYHSYQTTSIYAHGQLRALARAAFG